MKNNNLQKGMLIAAVCLGIFAISSMGNVYGQNINTFFNDLAAQTNAGQGGIKLLVGRILGVVLIVVLGLFIGSIWLKPEYSKTLGVSAGVGLILYWGLVQLNWLAI